MSPSRAVAGATVILATLLSTAAAQALTLSDGDWTGWTARDIGPATGPQTITVQTSGGNPGNWLEVETTTTAATNKAHFDPALVYDPSGGAILALDFGIDTIILQATNPDGMAFALLAEQGGSLFYAPPAVTGSSATGWVSYADTGLMDGHFELYEGSGTLDFSTSGAPIAFGLRTGNNLVTGTRVGYDNFSVTLDIAPIPVPATLPLVLAGVGALALASRRRTP